MFGKIFSLAILLTAALISCQRPLATGKSWSNFKITRLHRKNSNENPFVFGIVYIIDSNKIYKLPGNIVRVDERVFLHTGNGGSYEYSLVPGNHKISAFQLGYSRVKINNLAFRKGDSIQVDFLLHVDLSAVAY